MAKLWLWIALTVPVSRPHIPAQPGARLVMRLGPLLLLARQSGFPRRRQPR